MSKKEVNGSVQKKKQASKEKKYTLTPDKQGMMWDSVLYVTIIFFLYMSAAKMWYTTYKDWSYLLVFLGTLFIFIAVNRIVRQRMMLFPNSAIGLELGKDKVVLSLRSGKVASLVKDVRFFSAYTGKAFAVTGVDMEGNKQQHVFHKGQFESDSEFEEAVSLLRVYA